MTIDRLKELAKPITDGMFGKQRPYHYEQPHYAIRPVGTIVQDLCKIEDEQWYAYAFSRENLNGKFSDQQRLELTRKALACGREYAQRLMRQYDTRDVSLLAAHLGADVDYPIMPQSQDRVLFAEFRIPKKIHIYMDGINKGRVLMDEPGVREALTDKLDLASMLLGHELFHLVEDIYKKEIWTQTYKIELWRLGPLRNCSRVTILGEIAAMAFTQELNGLPYSPYVMDAFLVYGYSPEAASGLYEEMMERAGRMPRIG